MATIGSLAIKLTANGSVFIRELDKAGKVVSSFSKKVSDLGKSDTKVSGLKKGIGVVAGYLGSRLKQGIGWISKFDGSIGSLTKSIPGFGAALTLVSGGVALTGFIKKSMDAIVETGRFARSLGTTTEFITAMRKVAKGAGIENEIMDAGLRRLARTLGEARIGSATAADAFAMLGLNGAELAKMPLEDAIKGIMDKIKAMPNAADRQVAAFKLMGRQGAALVEALEKGGTAVEEMKKKLAASGQLFTLGDAANVEKAQKSLKALDNSLKAIGIQLAVQIAPFITEAVKGLQEMGASGEGLGPKIADGIESAMKALSYMSDVVQVLKMTWIALQVAVDSSFFVMAKGIQQVLSLLGNLPDKLGGAAMRDAAEFAQNVAEEFGRSSLRGAADLALAASKPWPHETADEFFKRVREGAKKAAAAIDKVKPDPTKGLSLAGLEEAKRIIEESKTPLEKYKEKLDQLDRLFKDKALNEKQYARATGMAFEELQKSMNLAEPKHPEALTKGSKEAVSLVLKNQQGKEKPEEQIRKALEAAKKQGEAKLKHLEEIAKNTKSQIKVVGGLI